MRAELQSVVYSKSAILEATYLEATLLKIHMDREQISNADSVMIGQDLLEATGFIISYITISMFSGDNMPQLEAAFMACVDQAPATAEYKLLQLRHNVLLGKL